MIGVRLIILVALRLINHIATQSVTVQIVRGQPTLLRLELPFYLHPHRITTLNPTLNQHKLYHQESTTIICSVLIYLKIDIF